MNTSIAVMKGWVMYIESVVLSLESNCVFVHACWYSIVAVFHFLYSVCFLLPIIWIKDAAVFQDGHYKVSLPWKEFNEPLANNYLLSVRRLRELIQQLKHDPEILKEYDRMIHKQLAKGVIEPVFPDERPPIKCTIFHHQVACGLWCVKGVMDWTLYVNKSVLVTYCLILF